MAPNTTTVATMICLIAGCTAEPPVRVATDATFRPFHYVDDDGQVTGFDVELARAVVQRSGGRAVVIRVESYGDLFEALHANSHDVIAATTGITAERLERYAFSRPYFETCLAVLVRSGPNEPDSLAALTGRRIAATTGTTSIAAAESIDGAEVIATASGSDGLAMLYAGDVDAIIQDEFEAVTLAEADDRLRVLAKPAAIERYGLVLRKNDTDLRDRLDEALRELEQDGSLAALRNRFGLERPTDWPLHQAAAR